MCLEFLSLSGVSESMNHVSNGMVNNSTNDDYDIICCNTSLSSMTETTCEKLFSIQLVLLIPNI